MQNSVSFACLFLFCHPCIRKEKLGAPVTPCSQNGTDVLKKDIPRMSYFPIVSRLFCHPCLRYIRSPILQKMAGKDCHGTWKYWPCFRPFFWFHDTWSCLFIIRCWRLIESMIYQFAYRLRKLPTLLRTIEFTKIPFCHYSRLGCIREDCMFRDSFGPKNFPFL